MTSPAAPDPTVLAARLADATGNLDRYIAAAAERIAVPRIAAAEAEAAEQIDALRGGYEARLRRAADLETELRRQLDAQLQQVARLRWAARYLPAELRALVLVDPSTPGAWAGDRPDQHFAALADEAAAAAGVTAYPDRQHHAAA